PLSTRVLGGVDRRLPAGARPRDRGRRRRAQLRERAEPLWRRDHRRRPAAARGLEPGPAARSRRTHDRWRLLRRQPRPGPQVRLRRRQMTRAHVTHPPEPGPPEGAPPGGAAPQERHAPTPAGGAPPEGTAPRERHAQRRATGAPARPAAALPAGVPSAKRRAAERARRLLITLLAALIGVAAAQDDWEPHGDLEVLTSEVTPGQTAKVSVEFDPGFDFDPEVRWGDGSVSSVDRFSWSGAELEHVYTSTGLMTVEFWLAGFGDAYLLDTDFIYVRPEPALDVDPPSVLVGEAVTATVTGGPEGGRLEWGDGAFEVLGGFEVEEYQHAYEEPGVYLVRMLDWGGTTLVTVPVTVTSSELVFDLDPFGQVGEPVTVRIEGLEGNAPNGARLDWGDGTVEVITDDGE